MDKDKVLVARDAVLGTTVGEFVDEVTTACGRSAGDTIELLVMLVAEHRVMNAEAARIGSQDD